MTNKEAIDRLSIMQERCENGYDEEALELAIKALDPRNDPHYDECDYCKYNDSSDDYPCSECKYRSKWEAIE